MRQLFIILLLSLACTFSQAADAEPPLTTVKLAHNATVRIPESWEVSTAHEFKGIPAEMAAFADQLGFPKLFQNFERLLIASSPGQNRPARLTVTSLAIPAMSPSWPLPLSSANLKTIETTVKQNVGTVRTMLGEKTSDWSPMRKLVVGMNVVLHTSYTLTSATEEQRVHVFRYYGDGRVYDIHFSTAPEDEAANAALREKIAESFVAP